MIFFAKNFQNLFLHYVNLKILWTERNKKYSLTKLKNKKFDFIISYRSSMILKNRDISIANIAAINLHPGPPKYRGIGCLNYALYNNEKKYGFTIHLINKNRRW